MDWKVIGYEAVIAVGLDKALLSLVTVCESCDLPACDLPWCRHINRVAPRGWGDGLSCLN